MGKGEKKGKGQKGQQNKQLAPFSDPKEFVQKLSLSPQDVQNEVVEEVSRIYGVQITQQRFYQGQLPDSDYLVKLEDLAPGSTEVLVNLLDKQHELVAVTKQNEYSLSNKTSTQKFCIQLVGLLFGFAVAVFGMYLSYNLIAAGKLLEGSIFGGATLFALVGTFVYAAEGRKKDNAELSPPKK